MAKFRSKELVEAIQFHPERYYDCLAFIGREKADKTDPEDSIMVPTEGPLRDTQPTEAVEGDWIVKYDNGEFDVFENDDFFECFEHEPSGDDSTA